MVFSDFALRRALATFDLTEERDTDLFADVTPLPLGETLRNALEELVPVARGVNSEKARSEFLVLPLLLEARRRACGPVNVLPGLTLDVDRTRGLNGYCDYVIARSPDYYFLRGPLLVVFEAKREDLIAGLGQCAAAMVAVREFNEQDGSPVPAVFGCVTSGTNWLFLRLSENVLAIDRREYYLHEADRVLAILLHIIGTGVRAAPASLVTSA